MVKKLESYTCILNKSVIKINSKYLISIKKFIELSITKA